jgi:hypothetical protein
VKSFLDKNPSQIIVAVDDCISFVNKFEMRNEYNDIKMWGKSISELTEEGALKGRQTLSLE